MPVLSPSAKLSPVIGRGGMDISLYLLVSLAVTILFLKLRRKYMSRRAEPVLRQEVRNEKQVIGRSIEDERMAFLEGNQRQSLGGDVDVLGGDGEWTEKRYSVERYEDEAFERGNQLGSLQLQLSQQQYPSSQSQSIFSPQTIRPPFPSQETELPSPRDFPRLPDRGFTASSSGSGSAREFYESPLSLEFSSLPFPSSSSAAVGAKGKGEPSPFYTSSSASYPSFPPSSHSFSSSSSSSSSENTEIPRRRSYTRTLSGGGAGGEQEREIEVTGEIVAGEGWRRHTRVFGGGVCRACEESKRVLGEMKGSSVPVPVQVLVGGE